MGDGWTDRLMDRQMDRWTDSPCVLQDFVPFGAIALLPINTLLKQGTGTADLLAFWLLLCRLHRSRIRLAIPPTKLEAVNRLLISNSLS